MKTIKTTIRDFKFKLFRFGYFKVTYTNPANNKEFSHLTNNMQLINNTKNCELPLQNELECLKRMCKQK